MTTGRSGRSRGRRCGPARDPRRGPRQHRAGGGTAPTSVSGTHRGSPDRASPPGSRPVRSSPGTRTPKQAQGCRAPLHGRAEHVLDNEMARHRRPCGARASHRAVPSSGVALDLRAAQRFEGSGRARRPVTAHSALSGTPVAPAGASSGDSPGDARHCGPDSPALHPDRPGISGLGGRRGASALVARTFSPRVRQRAPRGAAADREPLGRRASSSARRALIGERDHECRSGPRTGLGGGPPASAWPPSARPSKGRADGGEPRGVLSAQSAPSEAGAGASAAGARPRGARGGAARAAARGGRPGRRARPRRRGSHPSPSARAGPREQR